ncbi:MAG: tRNA-dihydrouridine synthase C [Cellvibrionaceae bacterium]|jgi:tRNA-dihydrouridine synthase C
MEGVVDALMRDTLSSVGGIDICVTEFIRVTDHTFPDKVFYKRCPELLNSSMTPSSTPVRIQLLGGKPEPIAENAYKAAMLGASAIDLNFGCPAKTVNNSDGGACLLKEPYRVQNIVAAVRQAVPSTIPVTAKIRLGFDDRSAYMDNALAAYEGGADELTVHARSKADGYKPPAYWEYITEINQAIPITVNANGDIWSLADYLRCRSVTGCDSFMLGRSLLACPDLALQIKAWDTGEDYQAMTWTQVCALLATYFDKTITAYPVKYMGNRLKQWLFYLCRQYPQAHALFDSIKRSRDKEFISAAIIHSMKLSSNLSIKPTQTPSKLNVA